VSATHEILREFSVGGEATTAALNRLDEIRAEFDQVTRVLRPIVRKRDLLVRDVTRGADAIREELDVTRHELAASKQELTSEHSSSERIQAEADEAQHRIQEEAKAASQQITELENRMAMLNAEVARHTRNTYRADVDAARAALARSEGTRHASARAFPFIGQARQQSARNSSWRDLRFSGISQA
jgi:chromosome segregation ATPase